MMSATEEVQNNVSVTSGQEEQETGHCKNGCPWKPMKKKCGASRERRRMRRMLERMTQPDQVEEEAKDVPKDEEAEKPSKPIINCTCECDECKAVREMSRCEIRSLFRKMAREMWACEYSRMYHPPPPPPYGGMYSPWSPYMWGTPPPPPRRHHMHYKPPFGFPWW